MIEIKEIRNYMKIDIIYIEYLHINKQALAKELKCAIAAKKTGKGKEILRGRKKKEEEGRQE